MKLTIYFIAISLLVFLVACCNQNDKKAGEEKHETAVVPASSRGNFGEVITAEAAIPVARLPELLEDNESVEVTLTGNVTAVCQMSGCWMDLRLSNDEILHVTFKDEAFLLPKDAAGKTAVIEGVATYEEIPLDMLKHMAKDEGKTQEEVNAITEPKIEYTFVAKGVILK